MQKKFKDKLHGEKSRQRLREAVSKFSWPKNFAQGDVRINFGRKIKRKPFKFFVENVVKGNSVQIALNFPAKSLSIYLKKTLVDTFLIIENHLTN